MKKPPITFSSQLSTEDNRKFKAISNYRGQSMASLVRYWVRDAYRRLPQEAKDDD